MKNTLINLWLVLCVSTMLCAAGDVSSVAVVKPTPEPGTYVVKNIGSVPITALIFCNAQTKACGGVDLRYVPIAPGARYNWTSQTRPDLAAVILDGGRVVGSAKGELFRHPIDFVQAMFDSRAEEGALWDKVVAAVQGSANPASAFLAYADQLPKDSKLWPELSSKASEIRFRRANQPKDVVDRLLLDWLTDHTENAHRDERRMP